MEECNLDNLRDMKEDEESLFVDCGYLKPPKKFKARHNFGTGPKTFDDRFPSPKSFIKEDDKYEYVIYRWTKADLEKYQAIKNKERKGGN